MNWKRFWLAALLVFVIYQITNIIFHSGIMSGVYSSPEVINAMRDAQAMGRFMWVMWVTAIVFSFFFTFIFAKGYEGKGIMEGIRYGIYITLFVFYVAAFNQFVMYPLPYFLVWYWIIFGLVQSVLMGIAAALVYRRKAVAATA